MESDIDDDRGLKPGFTSAYHEPAVDSITPVGDGSPSWAGDGDRPGAHGASSWDGGPTSVYDGFVASPAAQGGATAVGDGKGSLLGEIKGLGSGPGQPDGKRPHEEPRDGASEAAWRQRLAAVLVLLLLGAAVVGVWWVSAGVVGVPNPISDGLRRNVAVLIGAYAMMNACVFAFTETNALAVIGGYTPRGREQTAERLRSTTLGFVMVTVTGGLAFVAGYIFLSVVFDQDGWPPIAAGLAWFVIVVAFDTLIMRQSLPYGGNALARVFAWTKWALLMASRALLAVVMAYFIATPLTFLVISDTLEKQLRYNRGAELTAVEADAYAKQLDEVERLADLAVAQQTAILDQYNLAVGADAKALTQLHSGSQDCLTAPNTPGPGRCYRDLLEKADEEWKKVQSLVLGCNSSVFGDGETPGIVSDIKERANSIEPALGDYSSATESRYIDRRVAYASLETIAAGDTISEDRGGALTYKEAQNALTAQSGRANRVTCNIPAPRPAVEPASQSATDTWLNEAVESIGQAREVLTAEVVTDAADETSPADPQLQVSRSEAEQAVQQHTIVFFSLLVVDLIPVLTKLLGRSTSAVRVRDAEKAEEEARAIEAAQLDTAPVVQLQKRARAERIAAVHHLRDLMGAFFRGQHRPLSLGDGEADGLEPTAATGSKGQTDDKGAPSRIAKVSPVGTLRDLQSGLKVSDTWTLGEEIHPLKAPYDEKRRLFRVTQPADRQTYILKVIPVMRKSLEVDIARLIQHQVNNHPNVQQIVDSGYLGEQFQLFWYVSPDYGDSIFRKWRSREEGITWAECAFIGQDLLSALHAVHLANKARNLPGLHNDVKPGNVVMRTHPKDSAVLIDWGQTGRGHGTRGWTSEIRSETKTRWPQGTERLREIQGVAATMYWLLTRDIAYLDSDRQPRERPPLLMDIMPEEDRDDDLCIFVDSWLDPIPNLHERLRRSGTALDLIRSGIYRIALDELSDRAQQIANSPPSRAVVMPEARTTTDRKRL